MSKRVTKLPPTNGWRAPNGQMPPMEPSKFAQVNLDAGTHVSCHRCQMPRLFGKPCDRCERPVGA